MPDRGLVGDNRSSKVFEFATFSSRTQSRRFFFSPCSPPSTSNEIREGYFLPFSRFFFFSLPFSVLSFPRGSLSVSSFTSVLHIARGRRYKIYDCRYCEICGRHGARPKAGRFQVEIAFWRLIDSWLLESEWCYYIARSGTRGDASRPERSYCVNQPLVVCFGNLATHGISFSFISIRI